MLKQAIGHGGFFPYKTQPSTHTHAQADHAQNGAHHTDLITLIKPPASQSQRGAFAYLFPALAADPEKTLPVGAVTIEALRALGAAMANAQSSLPTPPIPAGYTYFGQFIDHDITKQEVAPCDHALFDITGDEFTPLTAEQIHTRLINKRTAPFDLDSLYGWPAEQQGARMALGANGPHEPHLSLPPGKDPTNNDLPRDQDGDALIGDPRNDENLIISQMQVAFLKLHNRFVETQGLSFEAAAKAVRQHYQAVVIYDFLYRLLDPDVVKQVLASNYFFQPTTPAACFMPLEFSVAAFRFGHSIVRPSYRYNVNFAAATVDDLFKFTAFSGQIGQAAPDGSIPFPTVPGHWIIQWENFLPLTAAVTPQPAMPIDTALALPLADLPGQKEKIMARLAQRNLLRGYLLNLQWQTFCVAQQHTPVGQQHLMFTNNQFVNAELLKGVDFKWGCFPGDVVCNWPNVSGRQALWTGEAFDVPASCRAYHANWTIGVERKTRMLELVQRCVATPQPSA